MRMILKEEEVKRAVINHIVSMGLNRPVGEVSFSLSRNPTEVTAEIDFDAAQLTTVSIDPVTETASSRTEVAELAVAVDDAPFENAAPEVEEETKEETEKDSLFG